MTAIRDQKPEVRGQRSEVRLRKPAAAAVLLKIIRAGRHAASARSKGGCCPELSGRFRFPLLALSRDPRGRVEPRPRPDPNRYVREPACCPGNGRWQLMALPPACRWEKCPVASNPSAPCG